MWITITISDEDGLAVTGGDGVPVQHRPGSPSPTGGGSASAGGAGGAGTGGASSGGAGTGGAGTGGAGTGGAGAAGDAGAPPTWLVEQIDALRLAGTGARQPAASPASAVPRVPAGVAGGAADDASAADAGPGPQHAHQPASAGHGPAGDGPAGHDSADPTPHEPGEGS
jgi:hypothetical protein